MTSAAEVMAKPISQQLFDEEPLLRMSYTALDGYPRVIPIGYVWTGTSLQMWTVPRSAKVRALHTHPRVAITIDRLGPPVRALFVRGDAELTDVEGVPDGYLDASHRTMPPEAWASFDTQVRHLYTAMTVINVRPEWAKLLDFETTAPSAVEELMRERGQAAM